MLQVISRVWKVTKPSKRIQTGTRQQVRFNNSSSCNPQINDLQDGQNGKKNQKKKKNLGSKMKIQHRQTLLLRSPTTKFTLKWTVSEIRRATRTCRSLLFLPKPLSRLSSEPAKSKPRSTLTLRYGMEDFEVYLPIRIDNRKVQPLGSPEICPGGLSPVTVDCQTLNFGTISSSYTSKKKERKSSLVQKVWTNDREF